MRLSDFRTHFVSSKVKYVFLNHLRGFWFFSTRFVMAKEIAVTSVISCQILFYFDSRTLRKFSIYRWVGSHVCM